MEDRSTTGYTFKQEIEDTPISDDGDVHYDFRVYESLEAAQAEPYYEDAEIVRVKVTIEELPLDEVAALDNTYRDEENR